MPTIAQQLTQLESDRSDLVDNLETQGITGLSGDETFTELVPEVLNISSSGGNIVADGSKYGSFITGTQDFRNMIIEVDGLNLSNATKKDLSSFFQNASYLTKCKNMNTTGATDLSYMFRYCSNLQDLDALDASSATAMSDMFVGCTSLTDTSLDNILLTCISTTSAYTLNKNLASLGWNNTMKSKYPKSKIESLPHYQDFVDAGWITW